MENTTQQKMDSLYGKVYPFYLENNRLSNYLLYQVVSPGVDSLVRPYLSLKLVGENLPFNSKKDKMPTVNELMEYKLNDLKIFNYSIKDNESTEGTELDKNAMESMEEMLKKFKPIKDLSVTSTESDMYLYQNSTGEFPRFTFSKYTNDPQKSVVIYLRNSIRWTKYKFAPGCLIDILWTPDKFVVFKIEGTDTEMWLTPQAMYKLNDPDLKHPMSVKDLDFTQEKFSRDKAKISEFNNAIKLLEWKSFERK